MPAWCNKVILLMYSYLYLFRIHTPIIRSIRCSVATYGFLHRVFGWLVVACCLLYGCETWSLTLWEERKLRVFENMVLRRIFGPRRDEETGKCRRLHNKELNDLYSSRNIVRVIKSRIMRWAGHVARIGEERWVNRVFLGKPEGRRPLGRPRRRWVDNITMDFQ